MTYRELMDFLKNVPDSLLDKEVSHYDGEGVWMLNLVASHDQSEMFFITGLFPSEEK